MKEMSSLSGAGARRVLVVAATCHPERGSEPGLGWNWLRHIAAHHDVVAIVGECEGNRKAIDRALAADPVLAARLRFVFVPWFDEPREGISGILWQYYQPLYYRAYCRWMDKAYAEAERLCRSEPFDLAHQLTMIGFREPGFPWRLPIPVVWGPVGGVQNVPWRCLPALGGVEACRHLARNVINSIQVRHHRRFRHALAKASTVFAVDSTTQEALRRFHGRESILVAAALCDPDHPRRRVRVRGDGPLRLVFSGLHLSRKGLPFVLQALAHLPPSASWTLDVLGHGIMSASWQRTAERLGLADRVLFHGYVPRERVIEIMDRGEVYVFPSLLEGWPTVIAESLSLGMPVVTTDLHGMRDMVTASCGRLVRADSSYSIVAGLQRVLTELLDNPNLVTRLSEGAVERANELTAAKQMPKVMRAYEEAIRVSKM